MGLVNAVVPDEELDAEVDRWCEQILRRSPQGLRLAKLAMNAATDALYSAVQHGLELVALNHVYGPEPQEGIASLPGEAARRLAQVPRRPGAGARLMDGEPSARCAPPLAGGGRGRPRGPAPRRPTRRWRSPTRAAPSTPRSGPRPPSCATAAGPPLVTYSRKVFIPLTNLCRDVCSYCTFAHPDARPARPHDEPRRGPRGGRGRPAARLQGGAVHPRRPARGALREPPAGAAALRPRVDPVLPGGDVPRWCSSRPGSCPTPTPASSAARELAELREVSASQGMMLESVSERLCGPGGPHEHAPDKRPGDPPGDDPPRGRAADPVHLGDPDRDRRDRRASGSRRCSRCATCTRRTATSRRSSCRTSAPSRTRRWPPPASRGWSS